MVVESNQPINDERNEVTSFIPSSNKNLTFHFKLKRLSNFNQIWLVNSTVLQVQMTFVVEVDKLILKYWTCK